ncbi:MAG TPA: hypothetical protein DCP97_03310 [Ruminococcaceae bacterium]|nr:hypothetical protein [Oscillospiraceae bacterium]
MKRIMIVDDSLMIRVNLKRAFEKYGYQVVGEACNGREAVEKYLQLRPSVVTMDITMPVMDGIAALEQIKMLDKNACVVMISALGQEMKIIEALNKGARHYILKPFKEEDVMKKIANIIGESQRELLHA